MSPARILYLILTIVGSTLPMYYFVSYMAANGWSLYGLTQSWWVNDGTVGMLYDLLISAIALTVFILAEYRVRRDALPLIAIPATFCIGVSCGLPLYLFLRSRTLD